jgi:hypothetical protein
MLSMVSWLVCSRSLPLDTLFGQNILCIERGNGRVIIIYKVTELFKYKIIPSIGS